MDSNNNKSGNNFFSGFLLGALIGAAIVLLFVTKKGKRILKVISEKGLDDISNLLEKAEKTVDLDEIFEEDESSFKEAPAKIESKNQEESFSHRKFAIREKFVEEKPKVRRFFKGISRHN